MKTTFPPKKKSPINRFIVPAILFILSVLIIVVFTITFLSMAGLTPGA
jgi:hypothetical protein